MNDIDASLLEVLKMAREISMEEYVDKKAQLHNKWLTDAELLWRTNRIRLAYPQFPPYPSEEYILEKAKYLLGFIATKPTVEEKVPTTKPEPVSKSNEGIEYVKVKLNSS